jgi:hypothetical protein
MRVVDIAEMVPVASEALYTLDSGEPVRVPLTLPPGGPASGGRITVTLPGPPGGGVIERADILAEDGTPFFFVYPRRYVPDGGTLQIEINLATSGW